MSRALKAAAVTWVVTVVLAAASPAFSQVTDAQRSAIRSSCRSDYQAHCASVTPGGAEALQCLQKNTASLSPACRTAVRAVEPPAPPKAEAAPPAPKAEQAPPAAKADTAPAAPKADDAASTAKTDAPATPRAAAAPATTTKPAAAPKAVSKPAAPVAAASPPTAPAAAPPKPLVLRPMLPREELFVLRSACSVDVRTLCNGVAPGGGRIMQCLATQAASLSPDCRGVLARFAAQ